MDLSAAPAGELINDLSCKRPVYSTFMKRPLAALLLLPLLLSPGCSGRFADALRSGCLAGCGHAPQEATSRSQEPVPDEGPAPGQLTMVWLHHSTGDRLLSGGLRSALRSNKVAFYDINYGEASVEGYVIGDRTDPGDFPPLFNSSRRLQTVLGWELPAGQRHHVVMFKSCYPASNIASESMLRGYQEIYRSLLPAFKAHPRVLFVPMTPPPLVASATRPDNAARARRWARWLSSEYARDLPNVQVFDLFDALAVAQGHAGANMLVPQFAEGPADSHPNVNGARAVTRLFIPWLNRAIRAAGLVK